MYVCICACVCSPTEHAQLLVQQARALAEASRCLMIDIKSRMDVWPSHETGGRSLVATVREMASATTHVARTAKDIANGQNQKGTCMPYTYRSGVNV